MLSARNKLLIMIMIKYIPLLSLIATLSVTCGKRKIGKISRKSQNIVTMIVDF